MEGECVRQSFDWYCMHADLKIQEYINKMHQNTRIVTQDDSTHPTFETNTNKKDSMGAQLSAQQTNDANIISQKTI